MWPVQGGSAPWTGGGHTPWSAAPRARGTPPSSAAGRPWLSGPLRRRDRQPPFFGRRPQDLVLHGQLPDLALGLPQRPIIARPVRPLALQALLATFQEVVPPGHQPVCLDPEFARQRLERLTTQQPQHRLKLLARRPPGPGPVVTGLLVLVLVVHRHDRHLHPCLLGVQENRERWTRVLSRDAGGWPPAALWGRW